MKLAHRSLSALVALTVIVAAATSVAAADWPQWRGPNRDGISQEKDLLQRWPQEGPKLVWKATDVGSGYSTPSVVGDRLYLLANEGLENEFVAAISARDGKRIWMARLGNVGQPNQMPRFPAARSTPTVEGDVLYALGSDGDLACLDTDSGKIRWRKHLRSDFGGQPGTWAYAESPLIDGDTLVATPGGSEATLIALHKKTGELIWKCPVPGGDEAAYASALAVDAGGIRQYVQLLQKGLVGVEAKTGKFLWRFDKPVSRFNANIPTPVVADGIAYAGSAGTGGGAVRLQVKDGGVVAEPLYFETSLPTAIGGAVKLGDYLYGTTGAALLCLEFQTGQVKWFVENLVRVSLDGVDRVRWPGSRADTMAGALNLLDALKDREATVEDAAEAAFRLYQVAIGLPNVLDESLQEEPWDSVEPASGQPMPGGEPGEAGSAGMQMEMSDVGEGEQEYQSPQEVDFRGDFKPELVQLLMKLREDAQMGGDAGEQSAVPLTPEQLQELLEKSVEIDLDSMMEGDLDSTTGMFMSNLMKEAGTPSQDQKKGDPKDDSSTPGDEDEAPLAPVVTIYYYDEWDFRAQDYKPRWCAVKESKLEEGEDEFYENTLREHSGLVSQTRKQFELMKPELFRKLKRLPDGEDIDLDAAIEWMVEYRAGVNPSEKIYWRRNKIERDVAVAFLIDMSASTDEEINKREKKYDDDDFDDDPRKYLSWWVSKRRQELSAPPKRIIDLERESTVLLMTALETIGDQYGIYGFSGYGRDNVEFFVIKDFDETLDVHIKNRLDKVTPIRSTRMGPAIRHATYKLERTEAKVKILFLLSDGRPQDHGYGRDRTEKEYAIHDTKQALNEAKRIGITPFCLTVDRAGHDYLKTMCEDIGYEVVADIEALPSRLPTLYRRLTE